MIEVEQLTKVYGADPRRAPVVALRDVSFRARPGRILGLLGPNGAGKTTSLRILSTVLRPSAGRAFVNGHDVTREPDAVRRAIGFLSSSTGVYDRLTPVEMMEYFGQLNGLGPAALKGRCDELTELLDMESFRDRPCGTLSTGQRQKASIARALIHDPPVLIFDEPTSGLDILVARAVIDFVGRLRGPQRTILLSTHIMAEAERLCDDLAVVHQGRLLAYGEVSALKKEHDTDSLEDLFHGLINRAEAAA